MDFFSRPSFQGGHTATSARARRLGESKGHTGDNSIPGGQGGITITETSKLLQSLPGWNLQQVGFNASMGCLNGTRQQLLDSIRQWVQSPDGKRILWLSGGPGTGKSSVAHSCAAFFSESGHLGASFFFHHDIPKLNIPDYLITNLCYQLAHFDDRLKEKILGAIQSMGPIPASSLRSQVRKLIVETTTEANLEKTAVLVVDAVDEAGTMEMRESLVNSIAEEFPNLPNFVKVIVTSLDERDIRASLAGCSDEICIEDADKTEDDIASYIHYRLARTRKRSGLPRNWPPLEDIQALCIRSGRLFLWASVVCNLIDAGRDHTRRLNDILDLTKDQPVSMTLPLSKLSFLYNHLLEAVFPIEDGSPVDYHYILGSITVSRTPLTRIALDTLLFVNDSAQDALVFPDGQVVYLLSSEVIIDSLRAILREESSGYRRGDGPIRLVHPSVYDFLTTHAYDHLRINITEQHQTLAIRCLHVMNSQLKFDICDIGDASLPNIDVSETSRYISGGLRYSCFSFVYHITHVSNPIAPLFNALKEFACKYILHWIEAMSLLQAITEAQQCLQSLASWIKDQSSVDKVIEMVVSDTIAFLQNCGQGVRMSALHTYYSALPLTPKSRELYKRWFSKVPGLPRIICSHPIWPAASMRVPEGHEGAVLHIAFSPDGKKLASASDDNTLRLWDVESGQPVGDAFNGHTNSVNHVAFSPDGKKLASASSDTTLRLWDVESGQQMGDALKAYTSGVNHIVFSPDGKKLASTADDNTLRLWDVESGQPIGDALKGITNSVESVVFSSDGRKLALTLEDNTLLLLDVESRQFIQQPDATSSTSTFDDLKRSQLSFDFQGFLQHHSKRLVWIPVTFRGCIASSSSSVVVGSPTGAVTFIHWPVPLSYVGVHKQIS